MKSGVVESSRPSRWDALCSDKDAQSSVSAPSRLSNSTGRRRRLNAPLNHMNGSTSSFSDNSNQSSASWRRRQQINNSSSLNSRTSRSAEDDAIRKAIDNLRAAINNENDNSNAETIAELYIALFGSSDPIFFKSLLQTNEANTNIPLAKVSNDMKWEAAYSLLQLLSSQTTPIQKTIHNQFILCIARTASACLHSLSSQYNSGCPSSMSDLRLSECITILLDVLQLEDDGSTTNGCDDLLCKSNLFQCIAKLLAVSIVHVKTSKNTKDGRGPLCSWGAEKAVTLIIKDSVLPFLEGLMCSTDDALSGSMKSMHSHGAVECIYLLLLGTNDSDPTSATMVQPKAFQASKHAAAMLAALVVDVMPDGRETQRVNPLRLRILRAVNACWRWSCESIHQNMKDPNMPTAELEMSLRCMTVTLITMHALERGKVQSRQSRGDTSEMDVSAIARDIKTLLAIEELNTFQPQLLRLLTSLCLAYPVSTANQWHLFLDKTCSAQSFLLSTVEEGTLALKRKDFDTASWALLPDAVQTVSSLISSIPFTNWIGGDGRPSTRMNGGNFACRVRNAMITLMTSLTNLITAVKDSISEGGSYSVESHFELIMMQSSSVAGKLCILLPFNDNNNAFLAPAVKLVQCAGDIFVLSARALESKRGDHTLLSSSMVHFSHVVTAINDGGASISVPVKHWLSDASSYDFIGILLNDSYSEPTLSSSSKCKLEMLTSIAKSAPWSITREPFNLASFREICANLCSVQNDTSRRLLGVKLIEAFIVGRKAYVIECTSERIQHNMELAVVPESFCHLLQSAIRDQSSSVRTCAVTSFGSLLVTDWVVLLSHGSFIGSASSLDWTRIDSILSMCIPNGERSGNVRAAACKAVGDICTVCVGSLLSEEGLEKAVPFSDDFVVAISTKVCSEMEQALNDKTVSVRSMALFAIGNTSLALKDRCAFLSMHRMLPLVYACMKDKDDKVVGNAIRTIGHVSYFVYTPEFLSNEGGSVSDDLKLYGSLLSNLTGKVHGVLCDATGETSRELTWKQRNSAKKHAWGAATTIGMLLGHSHLLSHFDDSLVESALLQLFRCIQLHAFINEKVFAAAVNALTALPASLWQYISTTNSNVTACGLATFFNFLESPQRKAASSYQANVERLAKSFILIANKRDFCQMFLLRESLPFSIDFLYQWLISCDVQSSTLEQVVDAVTSQEVEHVIDVSDIQIFLSRTAQHNQVQQDESMQSVTSDDEDEL
eukprot:scaffold8277_cov153-Skeletonema_marinoi.AAC.6